MNFPKSWSSQAVATALAMCVLVPLAAPGAAAEDWISPLSRDHPLVGKVWSPPTRAFVSADTAIRAAEKATYLALGEKHDNPDHHRLQARIVAAMAASGRRPAVVFEMIDARR